MKKKLKKEIVTFFKERRLIFILMRLKGQRDGIGGRILLSDNSGGAGIAWPIIFQCAGIWISAGLVSRVDHIYTQFRLAPSGPPGK